MQAVPKREFFGVPVHALTTAQVMDLVDAAIADRSRLFIAGVNAAKLVDIKADPGFREALEDSDVVVADGMSLVWAGRLFGHDVPERVAGIDLMLDMFEVGEQRGWRIFMLGAAPDVLERAVERVRLDHPRLELAGWHDGYFGPDEEEAIAHAIRDSRADILLVGITSPKKENFLARWGDEMGVPVAHGVGGSFDVLGGKVRRAPLSWQRLGFEWAWRLLQEPRRLWKRYLVTNAKFGWLVLRQLVRERRGGGGPAGSVD